ncbi:MAG TPA: carotenoid biosynthesis protein [Bacteroidia bacterium]|nr:carotenoid biosynthesis protein [Bacteroidia bacterium]
MSNEQKDKRLFASTLILVVVHIAGIIGIQTDYKDLFLMCTPFNLLLCIGLLFWNHAEYSKSLFIFSILTFLIGYFIEVVGVKTGMIFGNYSYGNTLGFKILDVPLIIGVNWLLLIYCVGVICNKLKISSLYKSLFGAALLTALDLSIEVVAIKYDFWSWIGDYPPFQNFIAWFIVSFLLLLLFHSMNFNKSNKLAQGLFFIQLVFFVTLSFL